MKHRQISLFRSNPVKRNHHKPSVKHKRKYSIKHWSYRQRLIHHVAQSSDLTYKKMDWMATHESLIKELLKKYYLDQQRRREPRPIPNVQTFPKSVDQKQLTKAVQAMYLRKHNNYRLSINRICKRFRVSKPTLYRGYKRKYGKG